MEVPAPFAGTVKEMRVKEGDEVSEGSVIATIEAGDGQGASSKPAAAESKPAGPAPEKREEKPQPDERATKPSEKAPSSSQPQPSPSDDEHADERRAPPVPFDADSVMPDKVPYASPAVRAFARELGVDLARVSGSERGGRITREDIQQFVKSAMTGGA
jgi:pyruvate dehydrogenase E2 component (dihydrolipoamide acetyltransferase)